MWWLARVKRWHVTKTNRRCGKKLWIMKTKYDWAKLKVIKIGKGSNKYAKLWRVCITSHCVGVGCKCSLVVCERNTGGLCVCSNNRAIVLHVLALQLLTENKKCQWPKGIITLFPVGSCINVEAIAAMWRMKQ